LDKIAMQMSEQQYPGKGVERTRGADGLVSPFCGTDYKDWFIAKAMKVCKERLYRTMFTCNKGQLRDTH
jgi:hypothetical protein